MKISIVTTLYKSADYISEFHRRISREVNKITESYELIFVNDGSPDESLRRALALCSEDRHLQIIDLSRNFGHHKALMTGLRHASGEYVFLIDSDLEEAPELLGKFWRAQEHDVDVIYGVQASRKGGFFEKWSGRFFYWILNKLIDKITYPADTLTARLMTRRYVQEVIKYPEAEYDLWSIFEFAGFQSKRIACEKGDKKKTAYTFTKKMDMAMQTIVSTSKKPLQLIFYLGTIIAIASFIYIIYLVFTRLFYEVPMGWTSIVALLTFILGIVIFSIGTLGIYISVIFLESKKRPIIIKDIYKYKQD